MGQELPEEVVRGLGPGLFVVAAGGGQMEAGAVPQPLMAQLVEEGGADQEALGARWVANEGGVAKASRSW